MITVIIKHNNNQKVNPRHMVLTSGPDRRFKPKEWKPDRPQSRTIRAPKK